MKRSFDFPLFLPNVVRTATTNNNRLTDETTRFTEARRAFFETIQSGQFTSAVVVDGSGCTLFSEEELRGMEASGVLVEQLVFEQDREQVLRFGKSNGEMQITEYMLERSTLVNRAGGFYKLSGRWKLENARSMIQRVRDTPSAFFHFHVPGIRQYRPFVCTSFYKMSLDVYDAYFRDCRLECGLDIKGYLESIFYRRLQRGTQRTLRAPFPRFSGIGGSLGIPIKTHYYGIRNALSWAGMLARTLE